MNVNVNINKLLYALSQKGQLYKINSFKFYNEKKDKYSTKYEVLKKQPVEIYDMEIDDFKTEEKYKWDYDCFNKIELLKYLIKEYEKGSEANGI